MRVDEAAPLPYFPSRLAVTTSRSIPPPSANRIRLGEWISRAIVAAVVLAVLQPAFANAMAERVARLVRFNARAHGSQRGTDHHGVETLPLQGVEDLCAPWSEAVVAVATTTCERPQQGSPIAHQHQGVVVQAPAEYALWQPAPPAAPFIARRPLVHTFGRPPPAQS